jgi:hypothetical protein
MLLLLLVYLAAVAGLLGSHTLVMWVCVLIGWASVAQLSQAGIHLCAYA